MLAQPGSSGGMIRGVKVLAIQVCQFSPVARHLKAVDHRICDLTGCLIPPRMRHDNKNLHTTFLSMPVGPEDKGRVRDFPVIIIA